MKNKSNSRIIADTSVWIEFLKNNQNVFPLMAELLERCCVIGVGCIFGELLQGVKTKRERDIILEYWKYLPKTDEHNIWIDAGIYSNENKLLEKGIGLIDSILIVLAIKNKLRLWTLDRKLKKVLRPDLTYL